MKRRKLKKVIYIPFLIILILGLIFTGAVYYFTSPVSSEKKEIAIVIESGMTIKDIAKLLLDNKLIRNDKVFYYYVKLSKENNIYAASYVLSPSMSMKEILDTLLSGGKNQGEISITFKEGINMRKVAKLIDDNTNNNYDDVMNLIKDKSYIDSLIKEYWFLTDDIKNKNIYYPLEGYLFPETYNFNNKDVTVKEIFKTMLDEMEKRLEPYKAEIKNSKYTVHQILTMASIAELEGADPDDRKDITRVFYNRLDIEMSLGSCATTYYAFKIDFDERELTQKEIDTYNPYNTRGPRMEGKLPIGPMGASGISSIEAAVRPNKHNYYYFVSDVNRKLYFTKNISEHEQKIQELKNKGLWLEW